MKTYNFEYGSYAYIAQRDLNTAHNLFNTGSYSYCGVLAQQCLEKIAKEYLKHKYPDENLEAVLRSHKLRVIYSKIPFISVSKNFETIGMLTDCYYDTRYPGENYFELDKSAALKYLTSTDKIYEEVADATVALMQEKSISQETKEFQL